MVFKGFVNGQEATLIQHVNQLQLLLTSMKKEVDTKAQNWLFNRKQRRLLNPIRLY